MNKEALGSNTFRFNICKGESVMNDAQLTFWRCSSDNEAGPTHPARSVRARTAGLLGALACSVALLASPGTALAASGPDEGCAKGSEKASFGDRLVSTYKDYLKWDGDPADTPPNWRKDVPPPPTSTPPYPFTNWPMGGTPYIGYENMFYGAFMDAVYCGPDGKSWKDSRLTFYGWIEPGMNISTSKTKYQYGPNGNFTPKGSNQAYAIGGGTGGNFPAAYSYQPNTAQLDQFALYLERTPDMVQKDHNDWGFRMTYLYGTDYKYTFSNGIGNSQYTTHGSRYGSDLVMAYLDYYVPSVAEGMNVRVGRYISIPDIEAQLAPNNYTYSHSLLYSYDPYTKEGIVATVKLNKNWSLQGEVSIGNDVSFWNRSKGPNGEKLGAQFTPAGCVQWMSDSGKDTIYPCINGDSKILGNKGNFGWNNLQHDAITWYHKFNDKWHMSNEFWYMYQKNTPNVNNPNGVAMLAADFPAPQFTFGAPFGAQCNDPTQTTCTSHEYAFVNYFLYQWGPRDNLVIRNEIFNDSTGQRTGFKTRYFESLIGWNHWIGKAITIRPELRYERASGDVNPYDNPCGPNTLANSNCPGTAGKKSQFMFAMDAIFHF